MESPSVLVAGVDRLLGDGSPQAVLDLGGGTGGQAVRLATAGHDVTVVDPSPDALAALARRASEQGVSLRALQGDTEDVGGIVEAGSIDLVLCHGVLEVVDDPAAALAAIRTVLRPGGRLSLLVAQRDAAVLVRVASGQVRAADALLRSADGRWGQGDPLQRRFTRPAVTDLLDGAGFEVGEVEGVRVFADLVPGSAEVRDSTVQPTVAAMERLAATMPALRDVAAQLHVHARRRD